MATRVDINSDLLTWAITRAGFELDAFLMQFPKVEQWIAQEKKPTVKQLQDFSNKVHIPFGYLLLEEPPEEVVPIPYFRTGKGEVKEVSLNVYDTIIQLQRRQDWLADFLEENEQEPLPFVGKFDARTYYRAIVADMREVLSLPEDWARGHQTWEKAINYFTEQIEEAGIIVSFNSVVGNNTHRAIPVEECRGFVLVHSLAPFLFVNSADAKSAQIFTLAHELAHIWLGRSAGFDFDKFLPADDPVEVLCNQVAAEFLVPEARFEEAWEQKADFRVLGRQFKVSSIVIARRALDLGKIDKTAFFEFYNAYTKEWKAKKKEKRGGGGDFYATARKRVSPTFAAYVHRAVKQNSLLYRDAYKLTGLKGDTFSRFMEKNLGE